MEKVYVVTHEIVEDCKIKTETYVHKTYQGARSNFDSISNDIIRQWYDSYEEDFATDADGDYLCLYETSGYDENRDTVMIQKLELQD